VPAAGACGRAARPLPASSARRQSRASMADTTMQSTTDRASVSQGAVMDDRPSSSAKRGAKATTRMVSFSATWLRVKCGSPSTRFDGRAGRCREKDEIGDVAVDLVGGQQRLEQVPEEQPARLGPGERLPQPVHQR